MSPIFLLAPEIASSIYAADVAANATRVPFHSTRERRRTVAQTSAGHRTVGGNEIRGRTLFALAFLLAGATGTAVGRQTAATDRPGLGFTPGTVQPGAVQFEMGTPSLDFAGSGDDPSGSLNAAMRIGVADRVEARLSTAYVFRTPASSGQNGPTGLAGLRGGVKVSFISYSSLQISVIPEIVLPVGNDALVADDPSYSLITVAGIPLGTAGLTLVGGAQADPTGVDDYETTGLIAAVLGHSLADGVSGYVEAGVLPGPGADAAYGGLGATWLPEDRVQIDAFVDIGLTDAASDAILGVGLSFLIL